MTLSHRRRIASVLSLAAAALASAHVIAHEFWIEPSAYRVTAGDTVNFRMFVGDGFPGEPRPRDPRKLVRFFAVGPQGTTELQGSDGTDPAASSAFTSAGTYVVGYRSTNSLLTLEAAKFESYLKEEGLEHVIKARAAAGASQQKGRENFSRAAKTIVQVEPSKKTEATTMQATAAESPVATPASSQASTQAHLQAKTDATAETREPQTPPAAYATALGFPAEIFPTSDPFTITTGAPQTFRIVHNNEPAKDVLVLAFAKDTPGQHLEQRTNEQGLVTFTLAHPGTWLIANVLMQPAANKTEADWESIWASLTIEVAGEKAQTAMQSPTDNPTQEPKQK